MLTINESPVDLPDRNFLRDDLDMLIKKDYIKLESKSSIGARYKLTRKGKEYNNNL